MKVQHRKLILTEEEKIILNRANGILYDIAALMEDENASVEWSNYFDSEDIWNACEIIDAFAEQDSEN